MVAILHCDEQVAEHDDALEPLLDVAGAPALSATDVQSHAQVPEEANGWDALQEVYSKGTLMIY